MLSQRRRSWLRLSSGRGSPFNLSGSPPENPSYSTSITFLITECPQQLTWQLCADRGFSGLASAQDCGLMCIIHSHHIFLFPILRTQSSALFQRSATRLPSGLLEAWVTRLAALALKISRPGSASPAAGSTLTLSPRRPPAPPSALNYKSRRPSRALSRLVRAPHRRRL